jgi:hypothetical protein
MFVATPEMSQGKSQFKLFKLFDGGGRVLAE